jgi:hypothetical protein
VGDGSKAQLIAVRLHDRRNNCNSDPCFRQRDNGRLPNLGSRTNRTDPSSILY